MKFNGTLSMADAASVDWDVVVLGAGVSGTVAAREAARSGFRVLLVDKRSFPRAKVCGACLNGAALDVLDDLGLSPTITRLNGTPLRRFSLRYGSSAVDLSLPRGLAVSREVLDTALVQAAIEAGVDFLPETTVHIGEIQSAARLLKFEHDQGEFSVGSRAVVAAMGLEGAGLTEMKEWQTDVRRNSRLGVGCTLIEPESDYATGTIWMAAGRGGYVGLVVAEDDRLNIAAALDREFLRRCGTPAEAAQQLLEEADLPVPRGLAAGRWLGTLPLTRRTTPVASRRVFLIGDAAGYVEPFTGEGMAWGLLTARGVLPWVRKTITSGWDGQVATGWIDDHRRLVGRRQQFCHVSTQLLRSPILARLGISALAAWPWMARVVIDHMNKPTTHGRLAHECMS